MQLKVEHDTVYSYSESAHHSVQYLRLTPRHHGNQDVWDWSVTSNVPLVSFSDAFGNVAHVLTFAARHQEIRVKVRGNATTRDTHGILPKESEPLPPGVYLRDTQFTRTNEELEAFAGEHTVSVRRNKVGGLHGLMAAIREHVDYEIGATHVHTTAAEAFADGHGVCQDHAHIFIACCRHLEIPARYVSGYLWVDSDGNDYDANHAWAEAWVPDLGWVSFDVANDMSATDAYLRVAVGFDYNGAAPVLGVRRGGGEEELNVRVRVSQLESWEQVQYQTQNHQTQNQ